MNRGHGLVSYFEITFLSQGVKKQAEGFNFIKRPCLATTSSYREACYDRSLCPAASNICPAVVNISRAVAATPLVTSHCSATARWKSVRVR
jgi:hypothetical protein